MRTLGTLKMLLQMSVRC